MQRTATLYIMLAIALLVVLGITFLLGKNSVAHIEQKPSETDIDQRTTLLVVSPENLDFDGGFLDADQETVNKPLVDRPRKNSIYIEQQRSKSTSDLALDAILPDGLQKNNDEEVSVGPFIQAPDPNEVVPNVGSLSEG